MSAVRATLITAGGDCLIYVWAAPRFDLVGVINIQATEIVAIAGNEVTNTIASVDDDGRVFVSYMAQFKTVWSFRPDVKGRRLRILVLRNGLIAIGGDSMVVFFTLQGKEIGTVHTGEKIVKWFEIATSLWETFIIASFESKKVVALNCTTSRLETVIHDSVFPQLVTAVDETRKVLVVPTETPTRPLIIGF
jgi:hypothetical protein